MNKRAIPFSEKIYRFFNKVRSISEFEEENPVLTEDTELTGFHAGRICVAPSVRFFHRGEIQGELRAEAGSEIYLHGKFKGNILAEENVKLRIFGETEGIIRTQGDFVLRSTAKTESEIS